MASKKMLVLVGPFVIAGIGMYGVARLQWLFSHPPSPAFAGFWAELWAQLVPPVVGIVEGLAVSYVLHYAQEIRTWEAAIVFLIFLAWSLQVTVVPGTLAMNLWVISHWENYYSIWIPGLWTGTFLWTTWQRYKETSR